LATIAIIATISPLKALNYGRPYKRVRFLIIGVE